MALVPINGTPKTSKDFPPYKCFQMLAFWGFADQVFVSLLFLTLYSITRGEREREEKREKKEELGEREKEGRRERKKKRG